MKLHLIQRRSLKRSHLKQHSLRQYTPGIIAVFLFISMLLSPRAVFSGAEDGLLLWFQIVFPTLFPFMLVSGLMIAGGGLAVISGVFGKSLGRIFATSGNGAFAILAGFLCGYPMGAKVTADLLRTGRITENEGKYLLSFCNNTSPAFIMNFIIWQTLGREELTAPSLLILFGVPVLLSFLFRRFYLRGEKRFRSPEKNGQSTGNMLDFAVLDSCMMDSFEGIVKVGGYIISFSILIALFKEFGDIPLLRLILPSLEITNGIVMLHEGVTDPMMSYPLIMGLTSFGGFCSVAQTDCMLRGTGISVLPYIAQKLAAAMAASTLAYFYLSFS